MARITIYKKSILANIVNIIGYILMYTGVVLLVTEGEIIGGVFCAFFGLLLSFAASQINENKAFVQWWKQIGAEREQGIINSVNYAVEIFNMNPCRRTLKKIRMLNEAAADYIMMNLNDNKEYREYRKKNNKAKYVFVTIYIVAIIGLAFFGFTQNKIVDSNHEMLLGTWLMEVSEDEDFRVAILEQIDFDETEIALVKHIPMTSVASVTFTETNFSFGLNNHEMEKKLTRYFGEVFDFLYQNRETVSELYGVDMQTLSLDDFQYLYAQIYGKESYSEMIENFSRMFINSESLEYGTYEIKVNELVLNGQNDKGSVGYKLGDGKLVLNYKDGSEEYVKVTQ